MQNNYKKSLKLKILTSADWLGCLLKSLAWKELGVSIVCCLVNAGCALATDPCLNHGKDIFLLDFCAFGRAPLGEEGPPWFDILSQIISNLKVILIKLSHWDCRLNSRF